MSVNDTSRNGSMPTTVEESTEPVSSQEPIQARESTVLNGKPEPATTFATRDDVKGVEGISKNKLVLLGGGLAVAVLFFVFTAVVGRSPKKPASVRQSSQQAKQEVTKPPKGSVTPLMDTVRTPAPDNSSGQLGPGGIRRTRSLNDQAHLKPLAAKPGAVASLGSVPSFADTQQKWEDPAPYGGSPAAETAQAQQNSLKEPSIIFVRSLAQNQAGSAPRVNSDGDGAARLELTPGTRIQAKLETQISSAVQAPVVAVVEYTYAIGDRIIVPAGARVYPNPQQLVRVWEQMANGHRPNLAESNFEDFLSQNNTFASLAAYDYQLVSVSGGSGPARAYIAGVSSGFFPTLGVQPLRGRLFAADEQRPHGAPAIIVSYGYWQRYLGSTTNLSNFHLDLDGGSYPVVGVMPPSFDFPADVAAWIPRELDPPTPSRSAHNWQVVGRVREGVTISQARANLSAIAHRIQHQYGTQVDLSDAAVVPLADAIVGDVRTVLLTLLGAVGLLLLVACANVAGLLVARTSARRKELAIRTALGAGRGRLIQQFLAESFVLSLAAGILGTLIAAAGVRVLPVILPANLPRQEGIAINLAVLLFALAATVAVAIALGLFAAWRTGGGDLQGALCAGSRSHTASRDSQRLRSLLVIGEMATTLVILVGAGLLGRSFLRLVSTSPGFRQENLVTMEFSLPVPQAQDGTDQSATSRQINLLDDIVARLRTIPGTASVGLAGALPVAAGDNLADGLFLIINGQKPPANFDEFGRIAQNRSQTGLAEYAVAGEDYFRTLGIPLLRGRMFGEQDDLNSPHVAVISDSLARKRWPNQDPIGQVIEFGNMDGNLKTLTIVGIVGDVRARGLDLPPSPIIYVDYRQRGMNANSTPTIVMRSTAPVGEIVSAARGIFHELAPDVPIKFSTFADDMGGWLADRRFLLLLVGLFACVALILAAVGLYGVVAFFVALRTQEIGVRIALGARRGDVLRLVLGQGARMATLGVLVGIVASLAISRLLSSLLFGISASDPLTFAGVALLLSLVALAASYIPARRAMRVDPVTALRYE